MSKQTGVVERIVREDGNPYLVKRVRLHPDSFRAFSKDLRDYYRLVSSVLSVPLLRGIRMNEKGFVEVEHQAVDGKTIGELMESSGRRRAIAVFRQMLEAVKPAILKRAQSDQRVLSVPIDPHPGNFMVDKAGTVHYVDLFPPIMVKGGTISFWETRRGRKIPTFAFRRVYAKGVLEQLLLNSVKTRPDLQKEIYAEMQSFLGENGLHSEAEYLGAVVSSDEYQASLRKKGFDRRISDSGMVKRTLPFRRSQNNVFKGLAG